MAEASVVSPERPRDVFQIVEDLGVGAYGSVHKALMKTTGQLVAIKKIQFDDEEDMKDVFKEISIMSTCHSPQIVGYIGTYRETETCLWIAMVGWLMPSVLRHLSSSFRSFAMSVLFRT